MPNIDVLDLYYDGTIIITDGTITIMLRLPIFLQNFPKNIKIFIIHNDY